MSSRCLSNRYKEEPHAQLRAWKAYLWSDQTALHLSPAEVDSAWGGEVVEAGEICGAVENFREKSERRQVHIRKERPRLEDIEFDIASDAVDGGLISPSQA